MTELERAIGGHDGAVLAAVVQDVLRKCDEWAALAPEDDWGDDLGDTALADAGRYMRHLMEEAAL